MNSLSSEPASKNLPAAHRESSFAARGAGRKASPTACEAVNEVLGNLIQVMKRYGGLLPSCLDLETHDMPKTDPGILPGQRSWDRALTGGNLMHDMPLLGLLYSLGETQGQSTFQEAADSYLDAFLERCINTPTGLFPWGEHAFWKLRENRLGDSIKEAWPEVAEKPWNDGLPEPAWHDHLRQAPAWFWGKVEKKNPGALQRFANGLDRQWVTDNRDEYNRHGGIDRPVRMGRGSRSCDFPRHSGFYIMDLACAWRNNPRAETWEQMHRFADYWWNKRQSNACLRVESRSPVKDADFFDILCPSQTLSLGISLMDAAQVLHADEPVVAAEFFERGRAYCFAYLEAPHISQDGHLVGGYHTGSRTPSKMLPVFGSVYGTYPQPQAAVLCCAAYRHMGESSLLDLAMAAARVCRKDIATLQKENAIPALDAGLTMELFADLHDLTGESEWLDAGRAAWPVIKDRYFCQGLVRLATGEDWYESQQGSGFLLHGVARFAMMEESAPGIPPDYSAR